MIDEQTRMSIVPIHEVPHDPVQLPRPHLPVRNFDPGLRNEFPDPLGGSMDGGNQIV